MSSWLDDPIVGGETAAAPAPPANLAPPSTWQNDPVVAPAPPRSAAMFDVGPMPTTNYGQAQPPPAFGVPLAPPRLLNGGGTYRAPGNWADEMQNAPQDAAPAGPIIDPTQRVYRQTLPDDVQGPPATYYDRPAAAGYQNPAGAVPMPARPPQIPDWVDPRPVAVAEGNRRGEAFDRIDAADRDAAAAEQQLAQLKPAADAARAWMAANPQDVGGAQARGHLQAAQQYQQLERIAAEKRKAADAVAFKERSESGAYDTYSPEQAANAQERAGFDPRVEQQLRDNVRQVQRQTGRADPEDEARLAEYLLAKGRAAGVRWMKLSPKTLDDEGKSRLRAAIRDAQRTGDPRVISSPGGGDEVYVDPSLFPNGEGTELANVLRQAGHKMTAGTAQTVRGIRGTAAEAAGSFLDQWGFPLSEKDRAAGKTDAADALHGVAQDIGEDVRQGEQERQDFEARYPVKTGAGKMAAGLLGDAPKLALAGMGGPLGAAAVFGADAAGNQWNQSILGGEGAQTATGKALLNFAGTAMVMKLAPLVGGEGPAKTLAGQALASLAHGTGTMYALDVLGQGIAKAGHPGEKVDWAEPILHSLLNAAVFAAPGVAGRAMRQVAGPGAEAPPEQQARPAPGVGARANDVRTFGDRNPPPWEQSKPPGMSTQDFAGGEPGRTGGTPGPKELRSLSYGGDEAPKTRPGPTIADLVNLPDQDVRQLAHDAGLNPNAPRPELERALAVEDSEPPKPKGPPPGTGGNAPTPTEPPTAPKAAPEPIAKGDSVTWTDAGGRQQSGQVFDAGRGPTVQVTDARGMVADVPRDRLSTPTLESAGHKVGDAVQVQGMEGDGPYRVLESLGGGRARVLSASQRTMEVGIHRLRPAGTQETRGNDRAPAPPPQTQVPDAAPNRGVAAPAGGSPNADPRGSQGPVEGAAGAAPGREPGAPGAQQQVEPPPAPSVPDRTPEPPLGAARGQSPAAAGGRVIDKAIAEPFRDSTGAVDAGKASDAISEEVRQALARGDDVTLKRADGSKGVPIVSVNERGMMVRGDGLPQGAFGILRGDERLEVRPKTPSPEQPSSQTPQPPPQPREQEQDQGGGDNGDKGLGASHEASVSEGKRQREQHKAELAALRAGKKAGETPAVEAPKASEPAPLIAPPAPLVTLEKLQGKIHVVRGAANDPAGPYAKAGLKWNDRQKGYVVPAGRVDEVRGMVEGKAPRETYADRLPAPVDQRQHDPNDLAAAMRDVEGRKGAGSREDSPKVDTSKASTNATPQIESAASKPTPGRRIIENRNNSDSGRAVQVIDEAGVHRYYDIPQRVFDLMADRSRERVMPNGNTEWENGVMRLAMMDPERRRAAMNKIEAAQRSTSPTPIWSDPDGNIVHGANAYRNAGSKKHWEPMNESARAAKVEIDRVPGTPGRENTPPEARGKDIYVYARANDGTKRAVAGPFYTHHDATEAWRTAQDRIGEKFKDAYKIDGASYRAVEPGTKVDVAFPDLRSPEGSSPFAKEPPPDRLPDGVATAGGKTGLFGQPDFDAKAGGQESFGFGSVDQAVKKERAKTHSDEIVRKEFEPSRAGETEADAKVRELNENDPNQQSLLPDVPPADKSHGEAYHLDDPIPLVDWLDAHDPHWRALRNELDSAHGQTRADVDAAIDSYLDHVNDTIERDGEYHAPAEPAEADRVGERQGADEPGVHPDAGGGDRDAQPEAVGRPKGKRLSRAAIERKLLDEYNRTDGAAFDERRAQDEIEQEATGSNAQVFKRNPKTKSGYPEDVENAFTKKEFALLRQRGIIRLAEESRGLTGEAEAGGEDARSEIGGMGIDKFNDSLRRLLEDSGAGRLRAAIKAGLKSPDPEIRAMAEAWTPPENKGRQKVDTKPKLKADTPGATAGEPAKSAPVLDVKGRPARRRGVRERLERGEAVPSEEAKEFEGEHWYRQLTGGAKPAAKAPAAPVEPATPPAPKVDPRARVFRKQAEGLTKQIEEKKNPAIGQQNITRRRSEIAEGMYKEGERLERQQRILNGMADAAEAGTLSPALDGVKNRAQVESILQARDTFDGAHLNRTNWQEVIEKTQGMKGAPDARRAADSLQRTENGYRVTTPAQVKAVETLLDMADTKGVTTKWMRDSLAGVKRLLNAGITNTEQLKAAKEALKEFTGEAKPDPAAKLKRMERDLLGRNIPGFFPTPKPLIDRMMEAADVRPGDKVLEPSAGKGDIADVLAERAGKENVDTFEVNGDLRAILEARGFRPGGDFTDGPPVGKYDKIVMNPPFENGQDMAHVRAAFDALKPGGKLVSIVSEGPFFRSDAKATAFRDWLEANGGTSEKVESGAFTGKEAFRQTGVATRMVMIEKPGEVETPAAGSPPEKIRTYGYDRVKMAENLSLEELHALQLQLTEDPANKNPKQGSIYLYTPKTHKRLDDIGWATFYKLKEKRAAEDAGAAPPPNLGQRIVADATAQLDALRASKAAKVSAARAKGKRPGTAQGPPDPQELALMAKIGIGHMMDGAIRFAEWSKGMVEDLPELLDATEDFMRRLFTRSRQEAKDAGVEVGPDEAAPVAKPGDPYKKTRDRFPIADEAGNFKPAPTPGVEVGRAQESEAPPEGVDRIADAAMRDPATGTVATGTDHGDAALKLADKLGRDPDDAATFEGLEEGFTTGDGRFVDRAEAGTIARAQNEAEAAGGKSPKPPAPPVAATEATPAPADAEPEVTSIKNAQTAKEREKAGLPPAEQAASRAFGTVWDAAKKEATESPRTVDELITHLRDKPRALTDREDAMLLHRQVQLQNEHAATAEGIVKAADAGDTAEVARLRLKMAATSDALLDLYNVGKAAGTETGRGLNARKMMAAADYSLAAMEVRKRAANDGRALTAEESAKVKDLHDKYAELKTQHEAYVAAAEARQAEQAAKIAVAKMRGATPGAAKMPRTKIGAIDKIIKAGEAAGERLRQKFGSTNVTHNVDDVFRAIPDISVWAAGQLAKLTKATGKAAADLAGTIKERVKNLVGDDVLPHFDTIWANAQKIHADAAAESRSAVLSALKERSAAGEAGPGIARYIQMLAREQVAGGVTEVGPLVDAVHEQIEGLMADGWTKAQTRDAISGYGDFRSLSKEEVDVTLRDLKGQMQQLGKLDDLLSGAPPRKTGMERRTPSDDERRLAKDVAAKMKELGIQATDPETQLKSTLDGIKTRVRNEIADTEFALSAGRRNAKGETVTPTDAELTGMRQRLKDLREVEAAVFGKSEASDARREQQLREAVTRLNEQLAGATTEDAAPAKDKPADNPTVAALKDRVRTLQTEKANSDGERIKRLTASAEAGIKSLEERIAAARAGIKDVPRKDRPLAHQGLDALQLRRRALQEELATLKDADATLQEQRKAQSLAKSIDDLTDRIAKGDVAPDPKAATVDSAEVTGLKAKRDELAKRLADLRKAAKPPKDAPDEQAAADRAKTRGLERAIEQLQERIDKADVSTKGRRAGADSEVQAQLRAERDRLRDEFDDLMESSGERERRALQQFKARTYARTAELADRVARQDFAPTPPRRALSLDPEALRLQADAERVRREFENGVRRDQLKNRTRGERAADFWLKLRRAEVLSSPVTLLKLSAAAVQRNVFTPIEELVGGGYSKLFPRLAEQAPREGGFNVRAEAKAITGAFTSGMKDAWQLLKGGESDLATVHGHEDLDPHWLDYIGKLHAALKAPVKRAEFERSYQKRIEHAIRAGIDVTDPMVQTRIAKDAYVDANRAIFMADNRLVASYRRMVESWRKADPVTGKTPAGWRLAATAADTFIPIIKVPTNVIAECFQYATGSLTGGARLAHAYATGIGKLTPEQGDHIMRLLKKGSLGLAVMLLGYYRADDVGGLHQKGQKHEDEDLKPGTVRMFGTEIPKVLLHNPLTEMLQVGATIRKVADSKHRKSDADTQGLGEAAAAAAFGLAEEVPFARTIGDIHDVFDADRRPNVIGRQAQSLIVPAAVQFAAKQLDKRDGEPVDRKPDGVGEHVKMGVPGLRQQVPETMNIKREHKPSAKAAQTIERLGPLANRPLETDVLVYERMSEDEKKKYAGAMRFKIQRAKISGDEKQKVRQRLGL